MGLFSGHQVSHPTDCFIRNVALICLAILGGLLLYDRMHETKKQPSKLEIECWFPAYFTENMMKFGTKICSSKEKHYSILEDTLYVSRNRNYTPVNITTFQGLDKNIFYQPATILEIFVTSQTVLVIVAFVLLRNVACQAGTQARILAAGLGGSPLQLDAARGLRRTFGTTVTYILIQAGYFIAMVVMVAKLRQLHPNMFGAKTDFLKPQAEQFLCTFKIRQLGNLHPHTVHCLRIPADPLSGSSKSQLILYLDTVLCGAVALMIMLHLIQLLLLSSASSDVTAAYDLQKPTGLVGRLVFGCTDMNLAAIFLNVTGHTNVIMMTRGNDGTNGASHCSDAIQMDPTFQKSTAELV